MPTGTPSISAASAQLMSGFEAGVASKLLQPMTGCHECVLIVAPSKIDQLGIGHLSL